VGNNEYRLLARQYFLLLGRTPAYFWKEFFVRESKRF
jgi:hypothetical protein